MLEKEACGADTGWVGVEARDEGWKGMGVCSGSSKVWRVRLKRIGSRGGGE